MLSRKPTPSPASCPTGARRFVSPTAALASGLPNGWVVLKVEELD